MADKQILVTGSADAPAGYTVPNTAEIIPKALSCVFDGTGASGDFIPVLEIVSDGGVVVAQSKGSTVTAGGSVEQTWFPRVGGTSTATPAASAYLYTFVPVTFTGTTTYSVAWDNFRTTDSTVFGTNAAFNANTPPHNTTGDFVLVILKDGVYLLQTTLTWQSGTTNAYAGIQDANPGYAPLGFPSATNDLASTSAPYSANGDLLSQDTRLFTIPAGQSPAWFYLQAAGQTATSYTMTSAKFMATWFGSGIGADTVIF